MLEYRGRNTISEEEPGSAHGLQACARIPGLLVAELNQNQVIQHAFCAHLTHVRRAQENAQAFTGTTLYRFSGRISNFNEFT